MKIKIVVKFKDGDSFEQLVKFNTVVNHREYICNVFAKDFVLLDGDENNGILVKQEEICCVYWEILAEE